MSFKYRRKVAVVVFNLGGPDNLKSVRPFLFNLFSDFFILRINYIFRILLAFLISFFRSKNARKNYSILGGASPLLAETLLQAESLQKILDENYDFNFKVFISMRYWHPFSREAISDIITFNPDEILCVPLYPHFSTTTTKSSLLDFRKELKKTILVDVHTKYMCCYYNDSDFILSHAITVINVIKNIADLSNYVLIFSAHSLPQKFVDTGDPYQWQIEESVRMILDFIKKEGFSIRYHISYQSKIGPVKWLSPSTEESVIKFSNEGVNMIIVPISFVSEHIEVLVELDLEYKALVKKDLDYIRVPTLRIEEMFIRSLYKNILKMVNNDTNKITSSVGIRNCPQNFCSCLYGKFL